MSKQYRLERVQLGDAWDSFARSSPDATVFVLAAFLASTGSRLGLYHCYNANELRAAVALVESADGTDAIADDLVIYSGTATPDEDIREILNAIDIAACFREVHGAPRTKASAIADVLKRLNCPRETAMMVGDAETDLAAARENSIPFLLRRTSLNKNLQARYSGPMFDNLSHG